MIIVMLSTNHPVIFQSLGTVQLIFENSLLSCYLLCLSPVIFHHCFLVLFALPTVILLYGEGSSYTEPQGAEDLS